MIDFQVIVNKIYDFHVVVKNISKLDSLIANFKLGTYKISTKIYEIITTKVDISQKAKIAIAEWLDFINPKPVINMDSNIEIKMSSDEYFNEENVVSLSEIRNNISSRESISDMVKSKLDIILDPTIGIFRKMIEFDSLILSELDNLTLAEMDYIEEILSDTERKIYNYR